MGAEIHGLFAEGIDVTVERELDPPKRGGGGETESAQDMTDLRRRAQGLLAVKGSDKKTGDRDEHTGDGKTQIAVMTQAREHLTVFALVRRPPLSAPGLK